MVFSSVKVLCNVCATKVSGLDIQVSLHNQMAHKGPIGIKLLPEHNQMAHKVHMTALIQSFFHNMAHKSMALKISLQ